MTAEPAEAPTVEEPRPRNPLTWVLLALVRAYQLIVSPWLPPSCKYYPSCSAYAVTALRRHGLVRGGALAAWRLLRCNPWSNGGVDHVPPRRSPSTIPEPASEGRTLRHQNLSATSRDVNGTSEADPRSPEHR